MNMGDLEHVGDTLYSFVKDRWYWKVVGINGVWDTAWTPSHTFRLSIWLQVWCLGMQKVWADDVRTSLYSLGPEIIHLISFLESSSGFPCLWALPADGELRLATALSVTESRICPKTCIEYPDTALAHLLCGLQSLDPCVSIMLYRYKICLSTEHSVPCSIMSVHLPTSSL